MNLPPGETKKTQFQQEKLNRPRQKMKYKADKMAALSACASIALPSLSPAPAPHRITRIASVLPLYRSTPASPSGRFRQNRRKKRGEAFNFL